MAAVLDAMAPYVKKLIADLAEEEVLMLLGASSEIKKLGDYMESMRCFLTDAERRRITDLSVQRWVMNLKDTMYDATDIMDLCQLKADKRKESMCGNMEEKASGCCQSLLFCLRNPVFAHKIGSRIKELNQRLEDIHKEADRFKFSINLGSNLESWKPIDDEDSNPKMTSEFNESAIAGDKIEKDTKELVNVLIPNDDHSNLNVVCIVGMGGIGKTTLAQKIFQEPAIQEHFRIKIWLSITQHFVEVELLRTAIMHAGGDHGGVQDKTLLTRTLTETLSRGRFLLVLDDVWNDKAWNNVLGVPVMKGILKQPGSRVLITTRFGDLAQKMQASVHQHDVTPLDQEDAWSLLKIQLPTDKVVGIDRLKDIGVEILQKCDGLPLAIKVIGGLLSMRNTTESEWKAVLNNPAWSVAGLPQEIDSRLYLSYDDLSPQLKQCFLYCTVFPKGTNIPIEAVTEMWISEGFIQPPVRNDSLHDDHLKSLAREYYQNLIRRNLIQPKKTYSATGNMCVFHDVVRSFAEHMAREELLVVHDEQAISGSGLVRRLSVGTSVSALEWTMLKKQSKLRTLAVHSKIKFMSGDSLASFCGLRVLLISGAESNRLVDSLCQLKHLRFLYLNATDICRLPDDIHKMKFLQYIALLQCKKLRGLPNSIVKLVHLRSLDMTLSNISVVPRGFGGLTNLRSLCGFRVHVDKDAAGSWCSLQELEHLSQLRMLTLDGLEEVPTSSVAGNAMLSSKDRLSYLELNYRALMVGLAGGEGDEPPQLLPPPQSVMLIQEEVLEKLCPPTCIETLGVTGGYVGRRLPNWISAAESAASFTSLRHLGLENLFSCTQLPNGLCCLPCLELLTIRDAPAIKRIGPEFQASVPSSSNSSVFPKLKTLQLGELCEWEEWEWNDNDCCEEEEEEQQQQQEVGDAKAATIAMPCLEKLAIRDSKVRCLPPGLANSKRHALRELILYNLTNLTSVNNFPSVVELDVFDCPELKTISGLSRLHKIRIVRCPKLEVLEGVTALVSMELGDGTMETLPEYLRGVNPRYLKLYCSKKLCESLLSSPGSYEWNNISHIGKPIISCMEDSDSHQDPDEN